MLGAIGMLLAEPRADFAAASPMALSADTLPAIAEAFGLLRHRAAMWFPPNRSRRRPATSAAAWTCAMPARNASFRCRCRTDR